MTSAVVTRAGGRGVGACAAHGDQGQPAQAALRRRAAPAVAPDGRPAVHGFPRVRVVFRHTSGGFEGCKQRRRASLDGELHAPAREDSEQQLAGRQNRLSQNLALLG